MRSFFMAIFMVFVLMLGTASAFDVCTWKDCPQPSDAQKGIYKPAPTLQIVPNINLNGETNYILWRKDEDGGTGFGVGVGTTIGILFEYIDIDVKYVKMTDEDSSDLWGAGTALDLLSVFNKMNGQVFPPSQFSFKVGLQGLLDMTHDYHPCGGAYAKIKYIF